MKKQLSLQPINTVVAFIILAIALSSCIAYAKSDIVIDYNDARRILEIDGVVTVNSHTTNYWSRITDDQIDRINEYRKVARRSRSTPIEVITINSTNVGYFHDLLNLLQTELEDNGITPTLGHVYAYYKLGDQFETLNFDLRLLPDSLRSKVNSVNKPNKLPAGPPPIPGESRVRSAKTISYGVSRISRNVVIDKKDVNNAFDHPTGAYRWTTRPLTVAYTNTLPDSQIKRIARSEDTLSDKLTFLSKYASGTVLKVENNDGLKAFVDTAALSNYESLVSLYGRLLEPPRLLGEEGTVGIIVDGDTIYLDEGAFDAYYTLVKARINGIDPVDSRYPDTIYFYYNTPNDNHYAFDAVYRNLYNSLIEIYGGQYGLVTDKGIGIGETVGERSTYTLAKDCVDKMIKMNKHRLDRDLPTIISTSSAMTYANSNYTIESPTTYATLSPAPPRADSSLDPLFNLTLGND